MTRTSEGRIDSGRSAGVWGAKHFAAPKLRDATERRVGGSAGIQAFQKVALR